jgi:uncharacterized protein (DUF1697 family)
MPTFVALLRGVNVGRNVLKMERLRALCGELGLANVRTYVQSGNVVFEAGGSSAHWARALEQKLAGESRLAVSVIVRSAADLSKVLGKNPFLRETGIDVARLHVTFLERAPAKPAMKALEILSSSPDQFHHAGTEIYLHCPSGYGKTKLSNAAFERLLGLKATTRNWNTVTKLCAMATT